MDYVNFLGMPVEGAITRGEERADQRPLSELEPLFQALLGDPEIHDFGWTQYTPYFNDGEVCVFSAGGFWVRTVTDVAPSIKVDEDWLLKSLNHMAKFIRDEYGTLNERSLSKLLDGIMALELDPPSSDDSDGDDDDEEDGFSERFSVDYGHPTLGEAEWHYQRGPGPKTLISYKGPDQDRYMCAYAVSRAIEDGAFDDVLIKLFGDHAEVHVTKEKVLVTFYEHD
jgi:hypothetical protein